LALFSQVRPIIWMKVSLRAAVIVGWKRRRELTNTPLGGMRDKEDPDTVRQDSVKRIERKIRSVYNLTHPKKV
jgi:hypothetical protein